MIFAKVLDLLLLLILDFPSIQLGLETCRPTLMQE